MDHLSTSGPPAAAGVAERLACVDVVMVARLLSELMGARLQPLGVSLGQLPTLLALYDRDGQTQSELARATSVEQPTMAANLRRMERDGLVVRQPDPNDRRRASVRLTERALAIRQELQGQRAALDEAALAGVSATDRATLAGILEVMAGNLRPEDGATARLRSASVDLPRVEAGNA